MVYITNGQGGGTYYYFRHYAEVEEDDKKSIKQKLELRNFKET